MSGDGHRQKLVRSVDHVHVEGSVGCVEIDGRGNSLAGRGGVGTEMHR